MVRELRESFIRESVLKGELLMGGKVLHGGDGGKRCVCVGGGATRIMAQLQRWEEEAEEWKSIQIQGLNNVAHIYIYIYILPKNIRTLQPDHIHTYIQEGRNEEATGSSTWLCYKNWGFALCFFCRSALTKHICRTSASQGSVYGSFVSKTSRII